MAMTKRGALPMGLELAAACCRWPISGADEAYIRNAAWRVNDWRPFNSIVTRNRITPLVHQALSRAAVELPEEIARSLSDRAFGAAHRALMQAREALRLQRAFDAAELPLMIVKGAPLAILAYGELGIKEAWDIDLLVAPEDVPAAARLLAELGYSGDPRLLDAARLDSVLRYSKDTSFKLSRPRITVELHWRLLDDARLLPFLNVHAPAQLIAVPGGNLRTLGDEELFTYLCVHGAACNWARLKWIADLGAYLRRRDAAEVHRLYQVAAQHGAARPAGLALMLCERLMGLEIDEDFRRTLRADYLARRLEANALAGLAYGSGMGEHSLYTTAWLRRLIAGFFLGSGIRQVLYHAAMIWNSARPGTPLPGSTRQAFLYHVMRIPLWLGRMGKRVLAKH